jgi:hypothetical protein
LYDQTTKPTPLLLSGNKALPIAPPIGKALWLDKPSQEGEGMCKHTGIVEAMRSAVLEAGVRLSQESANSVLVREELRYEAWLEQAYDRGCGVCQSLTYQPPEAHKLVEQEWFSTLVPSISL